MLRSFLDDDCPFLAGALAYQIFFALVPLLALVVGALGFVYGDEASSRQLARLMRDVYPSATNEELRIVRQVVAGRAVSLGLGLAGTVIGATAVFGALDSAFAAVLGRQARRSLRRRYAYALASIGVVVVLAFVSIAMSYGTAVAAEALRSAGVGRSARTAIGLAGTVVGVAASYVLFLLIYRVVPRAGMSASAARWAALVSAVLWEAAKLAFGAFARALGVFAAYGPLALAAGLLTWIYLTAVIILVGVEIMKVWERSG